jgi:L-arabinose transport system permease protein
MSRKLPDESVRIEGTGSTRRRDAVRLLLDLGMLLVLLALLAWACVFVPNFMTERNVVSLALSVSLVGMVACTMLFCLASGHFDLSVEAIVAMSGVLTAVVITATNNVLFGVLCGVLAGGVVGLVNGVVIAKLKINALITTLATMQIVRGLGFIVSGGRAVPIANAGFFVLGSSAFLGIQTPVWITVACFVLFGILLNKTIFGRNTLAIGGNEEAARLAGIPVDRTKIAIFVMQGLVAGLAGVVLAARMTSGQPKTSEGFALDVIAACVLGGVSLSGGVGTIMGAVVGVLIMGTVTNCMNLLNIDPFYQYVARGTILLAAVLFDRLRQLLQKA